MNPILRTSLLYQIWACPSDSDETGCMTFDICKYNSTKKTQDIKTIPLPNVAIPLVNPILRTSLLCQIWGSPRDYLIQMRQIVSIQNSIFKSIRKLFFSAFGTILVLVAPFFHSKLNLENIEILIFPSFWHDIGFGGSLFLFKIQCKKYSKFCFFPAFGTILVLHFFSKKNAKMQKNTKRIPPPNAAIPLVNPIFRTSLLYQIWAFPSGWNKRQDEKRHMMRCVFKTFNGWKCNCTKKNKMCKNDTSSKRSHTLGEPYT